MSLIVTEYTEGIQIDCHYVPLSEAKYFFRESKREKKMGWASRGTWNKKHVFNLQIKHKKQHLENQTKQFHKNIVEDWSFRIWRSKVGGWYTLWNWNFKWKAEEQITEAACWKGSKQHC